MAETTKYLGIDYETLEKLSADERKRLEYEAREKALHDYNTIKQYYTEKGIELGIKLSYKENFEKGFAQGIQEGRELVRQVFRLYMDGKSPDEIAEACQLTEDKVREILEGILEG